MSKAEKQAVGDEERIYRSALAATGILLAALALAAAVVGWLVAEGPGVGAALIGVAVAALAGLTTQAAMLIGHRMQATSMAALIMGTWLLKMIIIVVALVVLSGVEGFHRGLFAGFVLGGVIVTLAVDVWVIVRARLAYADPGSKNSGG